MKPPSHGKCCLYTSQRYAHACPAPSRVASRLLSSPMMRIGASVSPNAASRYHLPSWGSRNRYGSSAPPVLLNPHVNGTHSATNGPVGDVDVARPTH